MCWIQRFFPPLFFRGEMEGRDAQLKGGTELREHIKKKGFGNTFAQTFSKQKHNKGSFN